MNWISVSERLPTAEEATNVEFQTTYGKVLRGSYLPDVHKWDYSEGFLGSGYVLCWRPIAVPPGASSPCERCARLREAMETFLSAVDKAIKAERSTYGMLVDLALAYKTAQAALKEAD